MNILVTAIGSMSAEAVISALKAINSVNKVVGCDVHPHNWLPASRLLDAFCQVPYYLDNSYIQQITELCAAERIDAIIPLTDPEVDTLSDNSLIFENKGVNLYIGNQETILICRDKYRLAGFFKESQCVTTIPSFPLEDVLADKIGFPLIGKPKKGRSSEGLILFENREVVECRMDQLHNYIFQPVFNGDVYTVDVVRDSFGNTVSLVRKELLRTTNGAGLTVQIQSNHPLAEMTNKVANMLQIKGCINVEYLSHGKDYYLMDINPRFSAGIAFSQMTGYDMVRSHVNAFSGHRIETPVPLRNMILAKGFRDYNTADWKLY